MYKSSATLPVLRIQPVRKLPVLLPMYTVLYALFPWGFLTRLETWQSMGQRQYYYGMLIAGTAGHCKWWRQVTSFGVEPGALLWSARTYTHTFMRLQQSRGWVRVVQWCAVRPGVWPRYWTLWHIVAEFLNQQYSEYLNWCHVFLLYLFLER
jgi:hypothetical protein